MTIIWNSPLGKTEEIVNEKDRNLFWYGVTIGQIGFGILVSRKRQPTKRAADTLPRCEISRECYFGQDGGCLRGGECR